MRARKPGAKAAAASCPIVMLRKDNPNTRNPPRSGRVRPSFVIPLGSTRCLWMSNLNVWGRDIAARGGATAIVKRLLEAKADVSVENAVGKTPLQLATDSQRVECVELLAGN